MRRPDWQPLEMTLEGRLRNAIVKVTTSFGDDDRRSTRSLQGGKTGSKEDQISARTIVMPNKVFASCRSARGASGDCGAGRRDSHLRGAG